ncbi:MAG: sugar phosphate isomerase/epimerase [Nanoarchaeota archaeon]|nr:sugar phosphate isomerase/epimerase [Nanoarchaeota archaeon]MCG2718509.1 sugar phosphate isomerase/epimerase [Nanoarchaeota archaeon]
MSNQKFKKNMLQLAVKCLPSYETFRIIEDVDINAVEIYMDSAHLEKQEIVTICRDFNFEYAIHAPNDVFAIEETFKFARSINAKLVVTHDLFWEDEWLGIVKISKDSGIPLAIENVDGMLLFQKVIRRYRVKRCIDFEHLILQTNGLSPAIFTLLKGPLSDTIHVHLTGYERGSRKHHTHFYDAPEQTKTILSFLVDSDYNGMVVSEAMVEYQTKEHFKKLKDFYDKFEQEETRG